MQTGKFGNVNSKVKFWPNLNIKKNFTEWPFVHIKENFHLKLQHWNIVAHQEKKLLSGKLAQYAHPVSCPVSELSRQIFRIHFEFEPSSSMVSGQELCLMMFYSGYIRDLVLIVGSRHNCNTKT